MSPLNDGTNNRKKYVEEILLPDGRTVLEQNQTMKRRPQYLEMGPETERRRFPYDLDRPHRELLARWAWDTRHNSMARIVDERVFPRTWRKELDTLREKHRKLGIKDEEFYTNEERREKGLKAVMGRRSKTRMKKAA